MATCKRLDFVGENIIYSGQAAPGTLDSEPGWRISRVEFIGADVETKWAGGQVTLNKIWDDRLSYNYS